MNETRTILIADDDDDLRKTIAEVLHLHGWKTIHAVNGREAVDKVISEKPDLLILDNRMPEMTGKEAYRDLRRLQNNVPVLLLTAASEIEILAAELGIKYYMGKPFGIVEFISMVRLAIKDK